MTRSELIERLARKQNHLPYQHIERAVKVLLDEMSCSIADGQRIEIRGFGSFSLRYRPPRRARNPKTGEILDVPGRYRLHFKPGKELRERADNKGDE